MGASKIHMMRSRKTRECLPKRRRRQTRRRNQRGGFYPSVFGGVANATILIPAVLRQAYRLYYDDEVARNGRSTQKRITRKRRTRPFA